MSSPPAGRALRMSECFFQCSRNSVRSRVSRLGKCLSPPGYLFQGYWIQYYRTQSRTELPWVFVQVTYLNFDFTLAAGSFGHYTAPTRTGLHSYFSLLLSFCFIAIRQILPEQRRWISASTLKHARYVDSDFLFIWCFPLRCLSAERPPEAAVLRLDFMVTQVQQSLHSHPS
jgi:hypothetical protein